VYAFTFQRIQVCRQGGNQGLSFTRLHFRDLALMQYVAANQLHVKVPHVEHTFARFTNDRERLGENLLERLAVFDTLFEFGAFGLKLGVGKFRYSGF
jgi:hypothetical protein